MKLARIGVQALGALIVAAAAAYLLTMPRPALATTPPANARVKRATALRRSGPRRPISPDWQFITAKPAWSLLWQEEAVLSYEPASVRATWVASGRPPVRWSPQSQAYYFVVSAAVVSPTGQDPVVLTSPASASSWYSSVLGPFNTLWGCALPATPETCPGVP